MTEPSLAATRALDQATKAGRLRDDAVMHRAQKGPSPRPGDLTSSGAAIQDLLQSQGWEHLSVRATLLAHWRELVGADLADHVVVEDFTDGVLKLRAESTAWATQVRLLSAQLLEVLNARFGPGTVSQLEVHGPVAPRWGSGPRRVPGRGPRDTYG